MMYAKVTLINFNYSVPSHLKALFRPKNHPDPPSWPQALSFITCEGVSYLLLLNGYSLIIP